MTGIAATAILWLVFCVAAEVCRELCFKVAAMRSSPQRAGYAWRLARRPLVWAGVGLWSAEILAWVVVLGSVPLGVAFPVMTLGYAAVPLAGMAVLGERLNRVQIAGAALVVLGVGCIGWSRL
jgi:drug/metabolite transporter (DMT)-like permease